ncbi:MAG: hypothetical protein L3I99_05470 [Sulfurimonas sp.]|nr:hypothetical protein [Sulfurimonas sp.]
MSNLLNQTNPTIKCDGGVYTTSLDLKNLKNKSNKDWEYDKKVEIELFGKNRMIGAMKVGERILLNTKEVNLFIEEMSAIELSKAKRIAKVKRWKSNSPKTGKNKLHYVNKLRLDEYAVRYAHAKGMIEGDLISLIKPHEGIWGGTQLEGIRELSSALGMEDNSLYNGAWGFSFKGRSYDLTNDEKSLQYLAIAQYVSFLDSVMNDKNEKGKDKYPALKGIQTRAYSGRGHNSPATGLFIGASKALRFKMNGGAKSPGKLERMIWAVKEKALSKHKIKVSFEDALVGIGIGGMNVSKSATCAAANKLGVVGNRYSECRDALIVEIMLKIKIKVTSHTFPKMEK